MSEEAEEMERECTLCHKVQPIENFELQPSPYGTGNKWRRRQCRKCKMRDPEKNNDYMRAYRARRRKLGGPQRRSKFSE